MCFYKKPFQTKILKYKFFIILTSLDRGDFFDKSILYQYVIALP